MLKHLTIVLCLVLAATAEKTFREIQLDRRDCDAGWDNANGKCYFLSTFETDYFSALYWCKFHQGLLLEIDEEYEHNLVRRISRFRNGRTRYWIGVTDTFEEGKWLTATGLVPPSKMYWKPRQPDDWKRSEDCVEVDSFSLQWNDLACSTRLRFICEKEKEGKEGAEGKKGEEGKEGKGKEGAEGKKGEEGEEGKGKEGKRKEKEGKAEKEEKGKEEEGKEGEERKGKEGQGQGKEGEGKGKEKEGKEEKEREGKGKEGKEGKEGEGKGKEKEGKEGKEREGKGKEGKEGKEGEGKEGNGKEGNPTPQVS